MVRGIEVEAYCRDFFWLRGRCPYSIAAAVAAAFRVAAVDMVATITANAFIAGAAIAALLTDALAIAMAINIAVSVMLVSVTWQSYVDRHSISQTAAALSAITKLRPLLLKEIPDLRWFT